MTEYFSIIEQNVDIHCKMYFNNLQSVRKVVLYGHGFGGHKDNSAAEKFADHVLKEYRDIAVITFNAPCHGDDNREILKLADCNSYIKTVVYYITARFEPVEIFSYATSFGGYLILKYIAENENPFKRIVLRCPAVNMYEVLANRIMTDDEREAVKRDNYALVGFDRKIRIDQAFLDDLKNNDLMRHDYRMFIDNLLIMHGTEDEVVPIEAAELFSKKNGIRFVPVNGADHRFQDPDAMNYAIGETVRFLSSLSKKTLSSKVGDELRTNLLNVHMTIT